uniref:Uncharacterized protein n=1 Tax=Sphaerodactylus townsendi TaxID=933632 RepID=A0ACB8G1Z3_9SAUR
MAFLHLEEQDDSRIQELTEEDEELHRELLPYRPATQCQPLPRKSATMGSPDGRTEENPTLIARIGSLEELEKEREAFQEESRPTSARLCQAEMDKERETLRRQ